MAVDIPWFNWFAADRAFNHTENPCALLVFLVSLSMVQGEWEEARLDAFGRRASRSRYATTDIPTLDG